MAGPAIPGPSVGIRASQAAEGMRTEISRTGIAQRQLEDDDPCVHEYISLKDLPTTASRSDISRTGIAPWLLVHGS